MTVNALGTVLPGSTLEFPFHTFDSNDPSASVTLTGLALADILVYKDGGTTQRASTSGFTLLDTDGIDFDGQAGLHGFSIDLSDNTTAGFYEAGSRYMVAVSAVTVDAATVRFWAGSFRIGYPGALLDTTVATLASQTSFTLEEGPADNDALNGCRVVVHDLASAVQIAQGFVSDYVGATKTVTLAVDPGIFTMAAGDNISFFPRVDVGAVSGDQTAADNLETACDNYSATRGLSGTALPAAAADGAGGLVISDAGGLDADTLNSNVVAILADTGTDGVVVAAGSKTGYSISGTKNTLDDLNDITVANVLAGIIEGSITLQQVLRVLLAAEAGKSNGAGGATFNLRDQADGKNRISASIDGSGNRTATTLDLT